MTDDATFYKGKSQGWCYRCGSDHAFLEPCAASIAKRADGSHTCAHCHRAFMPSSPRSNAKFCDPVCRTAAKIKRLSA
jgi:hypothetical protein